MRVAVTGGGGFIGRRVVDLLLGSGHQVRCLVRRPQAASPLVEAGAEVVAGDVLDPASLDRAFAGTEAVFHLAATYAVGVGRAAGERMVADNVQGTRNVLERALRAGAERIVYTSSCTVYVNTGGQVVDESWRWQGKEFPNAYVESKHRAHREVAEPMMADGAPIVALQPGAVLGPGDTSSFNLPFEWLAAGLPIPLGGSRWAMVGVRDCARAHLLALERGTPGSTYNVVAENLSVREAVTRAAAASGLRARVVPVPDPMVAAGAAFARLLERVVVLPRLASSEVFESQRSTLTQLMSGERARRELGFEPEPLDGVFAEVVAFERARRGAA